MTRVRTAKPRSKNTSRSQVNVQRPVGRLLRRANLRFTGKPNVNIRALTADGDLIWNVDTFSGITLDRGVNHAQAVHDVALDSADRVVAGGDARTDDGAESLFVYDRDGTLQWRRDAGSKVLSVATDSSDNIYAGTVGSIVKYDGDGNLVWTLAFDTPRDESIDVRSIDADSFGDVVAVTSGDAMLPGLGALGRVHKLSGSAAPIWSIFDSSARLVELDHSPLTVKVIGSEYYVSTDGGDLVGTFLRSGRIFRVSRSGSWPLNDPARGWTMRDDDSHPIYAFARDGDFVYVAVWGSSNSPTGRVVQQISKNDLSLDVSYWYKHLRGAWMDAAVLSGGDPVVVSQSDIGNFRAATIRVQQEGTLFDDDEFHDPVWRFDHDKAASRGLNAVEVDTQNQIVIAGERVAQRG